MVAKEWRDAGWKAAIGAALLLALVAINLLPYEMLVGNLTGEQTPERSASA